MSNDGGNEVAKKAPVKVTGGAGYRFEDYVAARLMIDMLLQLNSFGTQELGPIVRLDWQARDQGWLADDLAVTSQNQSKLHVVGVSVKSGHRVTESGFPTDFVALAWNQWCGNGNSRHLRASDDVIALVTGDGTDAAQYPWNTLLSQ